MVRAKGGKDPTLTIDSKQRDSNSSSSKGKKSNKIMDADTIMKEKDLFEDGRDPRDSHRGNEERGRQ